MTQKTIYSHSHLYRKKCSPISPCLPTWNFIFPQTCSLRCTLTYCSSILIQVTLQKWVIPINEEDLFLGLFRHTDSCILRLLTPLNIKVFSSSTYLKQGLKPLWFLVQRKGKRRIWGQTIFCWGKWGRNYLFCTQQFVHTLLRNLNCKEGVKPCS